jgi:septal ring factor EnvC (AmiA/AmiB activator)
MSDDNNNTKDPDGAVASVVGGQDGSSATLPTSLQSGRSSGSRFWVASALVHAVAAVAVLFSPVGEIIMERDQKPEVIRQGEELAEVIDDIRDLTVRRLQQQVELLESGQQRMTENFDILNKHYQPYESMQRATALARFIQESDQTLAWQEKLMELAKAARKDGGDPQTAFDYFEQHQARILQGIEEVRTVIYVLAPDNEELHQLQRDAESGQVRAIEHFGWARDSWNSFQSSKRDAENWPKEIAGLEQAVATADKRMDILQKKSDRLKKIVDQAKQAERQARKNKDAEEKKRQGRIQKKASDDKRQVDKEMREWRDKKRKAERELDHLQPKLAEVDERLTKGEKGYLGNLTVAGNIQTAAYYKQRDAIDGLRQLLQTNGDMPKMEETP